MNIRMIVGRVLTAAVAVALAVFAIAGITPPWYAAVMALAVPIINVLIGSWEAPK